jgi:uncharacterized membrane protein
MSENSSSRWWEFYAVRYAMGTMVGAMVFYFLCSMNPGWSSLLFETVTQPDTHAVTFHLVPMPLDKLRLTLLIAYGLVYCYIASAPILVFHASRFLFGYSVRKKEVVWWTVRYMLLPVAAAVYVSVHWKYRVFGALLGFVWTFILCAQYLLALRTIIKRKELYAFYEKLASRRQEAEGDILDSYRHLREHGNSFFIVFLEIVLGLPLFIVGRLQIEEGLPPLEAFAVYLAILFLWILPSVGVWFIATIFEREFSEASGRRPSL